MSQSEDDIEQDFKDWWKAEAVPALACPPYTASVFSIARAAYWAGRKSAAGQWQISASGQAGAGTCLG